MDTKYDQSFRKAELGVKKENEEKEIDNMDDNSDEEAERMSKMDDYFTREPDSFGGRGGWQI